MIVEFQYEEKTIRIDLTPHLDEKPVPSTAQRVLKVDFDGVIHAYTSGWQGAAVIPDPPVVGAFDWLKAVVRDFTVAVYSSRSKQPGGIKAMQAWFLRHGWPEDTDGTPAGLYFPADPPLCWLALDDRTLQFCGTFPSVAELQTFQAWWRRQE